MAHCKQALKRIRQSEKKRIKTKSIRNEIKTISKRIAEAVAKKDSGVARGLLTDAVSRIDKAAKVHAYKRNAAARRKSKLVRLVNTLGLPAAAAPATGPAS